VVEAAKKRGGKVSSEERRTSEDFLKFPFSGNLTSPRKRATALFLKNVVWRKWPE